MMQLSRWALPALLVLWGIALPAIADEGADDRATKSPAAVIENLHEAMVATLKESEALGYSGRFEKLAPVIAATFDLDFMAEKSVGAHWRKFSDEEREQWRDLFERNMVASYASRLGGFHGQEFVVVGSEDAGRDTVAVRTRIHDPGKEVVSITYRLREIDAGWRVIDLYLKGTVSELAVRRSDYAAVLRSGGFPALKESIEGKISEYQAG